MGGFNWGCDSCIFNFSLFKGNIRQVGKQQVTHCCNTKILKPDLPGGGKEKNRCWAGWFRALNIHIPAAALISQNRRNSLPSATPVRRLVEETAMLQQSVFLKNSFLKKVCPQYGISLEENMYDTM